MNPRYGDETLFHSRNGERILPCSVRIICNILADREFRVHKSRGPLKQKSSVTISFLDAGMDEIYCSVGGSWQQHFTAYNQPHKTCTSTYI